MIIKCFCFNKLFLFIHYAHIIFSASLYALIHWTKITYDLRYKNQKNKIKVKIRINTK